MAELLPSLIRSIEPLLTPCQVAPTRINHQVLLKDGSVIAVDKQETTPQLRFPTCWMQTLANTTRLQKRLDRENLLALSFVTVSRKYICHSCRVKSS